MKNISVQCIKNLIFRFFDDDILALSSQLAYGFIFAFFPFMIFLMTLIGYSPISSGNVLDGLDRLLPDEALYLIKTTVIEVVDSRKSNLMSFSLIFTIWSVSSGFDAVIKGINKAYDEKENRSYFKLKLISILFTFELTVMILILIFLLVFGQIIGNSIASKYGFSYQFKVIWNFARYAIIISTTIFIFASLYHYTPSKRLAWSDVMPGSFFATIGLILVSIGFAYYVNTFTNYSLLYGSIGAVIVFLTWLFLMSIIILLGGEINAIFVSKCGTKE
ncbi:YihY/virulence factor BrkB family protein [Clostridium fermenticellae]|uniref:YihY/virulence factor BrkB family protein n=1 Tax=Clostridium fermenticellae TaxID=2068654 RepID=A0A386H131_9CLOT|nr:YihY/virulence factor BrkB family protein [Clostridium fermenticellae]AYD39374.1 YihY/virulence factor BrkB family protein [Clostridium fermenticellae]